MSFVLHRSIIVTSWSEKHIKDARISAITTFGDRVSEIVKSPINAYLSFFIAPCGSKEGWDDQLGDRENRRFYLENIDCEYLEWVEVEYGYSEYEDK